MIGVALLLLQTTAAIPNAPLPADQRAAADRLLVATGADTRRATAIDNVEDKALVFSDIRCAADAAGGHALIVACARKSALGRQLVAALDAARPELLSAIADVQERAYAARLTIAEMDAATAFARTAAGARFFAAVQTAGVEANTRSTELVLERAKVILDAIAARSQRSDTVTESDK